MSGRLVPVSAADAPASTDADRVSLWLMSADGLGAVNRTLRDLRLPDAFDTDLIISVCHSAGQMVAKQEAIESIPAWTTRTLKLRAIDLVRSPRTSQLQLVVDNSDDFADRLADPTDQIAAADAQLDAVTVRRQLSDAWYTKPPWSVSAALTVLTVLYDEARPSDDCPKPVSGASVVEAAHWVGLWYSGKRDVFPAADQLADHPADNTITKRRSRATSEVRNLLRTNAASTTGRG